MSPEPVVFTIAAPEPAGGSLADAWADLDMAAIETALQQDGVWAPDSQLPRMKKVVADAAADGHDLHVVVLDQSFSPFTVYRDIAHELQSTTGGTVLVFGPSGLGTASDDFSRVELEDASHDISAGASAPQAARELYSKAIDPSVNWTLATLVLIVIVVIGAVVARVWNVRRRNADASSAESDGGRTDENGSTDEGGDEPAANGSDGTAGPHVGRL